MFLTNYQNEILVVQVGPLEINESLVVLTLFFTLYY